MYLFALFFVIFEFTTYAANDMILPGMLEVVHYFNSSEYYVSLSMSYYILGNCFFLLFAGFLSERFGKSKIILSGNFIFLLFTLLVIYSANMSQFMLWRFLQGAGLAVVSIGYAVIHERFNDKMAIKLQALMANVSLLAPLIGPALGSLIMSFYSWQYIFYLTAALAIFTFFGLLIFTPKDISVNSSLSVKQVSKDYIAILTNKEFFKCMLSSVLIVLPLLIWISQAPNLILYKLQLNYTHYVVYQLISIGGLSISSIFMQFIVGRYRMYSIVVLGSVLVLVGSIVVLLGFNSIILITSGLFIYAFGMGLANGCLWRLIMTVQGYSHAMLASMMGFMQALVFSVGIVVLNNIMDHYQFSLLCFSSSVFLCGFIGFCMTMFCISAYRNRGWQ